MSTDKLKSSLTFRAKPPNRRKSTVVKLPHEPEFPLLPEEGTFEEIIKEKKAGVQHSVALNSLIVSLMMLWETE
ncbi:MAG: hypothetical protein ACREXW_19500 [Gammaproteobacteria bacterium]